MKIGVRGVTRLPAASGRAHRGELWGVCPSSSLVQIIFGFPRRFVARGPFNSVHEITQTFTLFALHFSTVVVAVVRTVGLTHASLFMPVAVGQ